jgi:hypothetical protein
MKTFNVPVLCTFLALAGVASGKGTCGSGSHGGPCTSGPCGGSHGYGKGKSADCAPSYGKPPPAPPKSPPTPPKTPPKTIVPTPPVTVVVPVAPKLPAPLAPAPALVVAPPPPAVVVVVSPPAKATPQTSVAPSIGNTGWIPLLLWVHKARVILEGFSKEDYRK